VSTVPVLFRGLVDDAALFPPGNAAMADAVPAHAARRRAWYAPLVGPFLCPASRLAELAELAGETGTSLSVGVIVDTGTGGIEPAVAAVRADPLLELRSIDVPLRGEPLAEAARRAAIALDGALDDLSDDPAGDASAEWDELPVYLEVLRGPGWRRALEVVAETGYRAKLRTGGVTPDAFPAEAEVAAFILACLELDVPFKFTAGLHRAIRNTTGDGIEQHGFGNVLLAVADALDGADAPTIEQTLADRDTDRITDRMGALPSGRAAGVRSWLASYGSCSIDEPVDDLLALGLITKE
jgi:hypothetical protein